MIFRPSDIVAGDYHFDIGTAGSTTLVAETVLPSLLTADSPSQLVIEGGTHNAKAPPFEFLDLSLLPLLNRMGPRIAATLERHGFYPRGGGRIRVKVNPAPRLARLSILERGETSRIYAVAAVANLPEHIAERELAVIGEEFALHRMDLISRRLTDVFGPGNVVMVVVESAFITEVMTGFGQRGVRAERVASELADEARRYIASGVPVGQHLADQILVPLALAGGGCFLTLRPSLHTITNIAVVEQFLDVRVEQQEVQPGVWRIGISR
jgi:RNA 3'-terminal phosphate cyclase (ATP)